MWRQRWQQWVNGINLPVDFSLAVSFAQHTYPIHFNGPRTNLHSVLAISFISFSAEESIKGQVIFPVARWPRKHHQSRYSALLLFVVRYSDSTHCHRYLICWFFQHILLATHHEFAEVYHQSNARRTWTWLMENLPNTNKESKRRLTIAPFDSEFLLKSYARCCLCWYNFRFCFHLQNHCWKSKTTQ